MKIRIAEIQTIQELYPRNGHSNDIVVRYRQALDKLPPILINQDKILIDGYHRLQAYQTDGKKEIEAEIKEVPAEDILELAIRLNSTHGKQLTVKEKRRHIQTFWLKKSKGPKDTELVQWLEDLLSVTPQSIYNATKDLRDGQKEDQKEEAWQMWLACKTQEEIGETLDVRQPTIRKWIHLYFSQNFEKSIIDSLRLYDIWNFSGCDNRYGLPGFPGRIPGQIIENILYYYTDVGDVVLDPMAGGGTVIDVCKAMGRRYLAYDIQPFRSDIQKHDITTGMPTLPHVVIHKAGIKLVFVDPPYWTMKAGDYGEDSVSAKTLSEFNEWITQLGKIVFDILTPGGYFAFLIQNQTEKDIPEDMEYIEHVFEAHSKFCNIGFIPVRRIACPQGSQTFTPQQVEKSKETKHLMGLVRDLLIMKKPEND